MSEDQEITGYLGEQWIVDAIDDVRMDCPSIDSIVLTRLEELLQDKLSDRGLTPANLRELSATLIEEFVLKTTEPETENED